LVVAVAALAQSPADSAEAASIPVAEGHAQVASKAPVALAVPRDGRINGYGYAAEILGVATGPDLGSYRAPAGQHLWAFGMRWDRSNVTPDAQLNLEVDADGVRTLLPIPSSLRGTGEPRAVYWVASEPAATGDVTVRVGTDNFTQTFSLSRMQRQGPQPAALYRNATGWDTTVPVDQTLYGPIPDPLNYYSGIPLPIDLHSVDLTYFGPGGSTDTPPPGTYAWLTLHISSQTSSAAANSSQYYLQGLPADQVTLTVPHHAPQPATITPRAGIDRARVGVFPGGYSFKVSDHIGTATLTVHPHNVPMSDGQGDSDGTISTRPAVFYLTIPSAITPTVPIGASTTPRRYQATPAPTASRRSGSSGRHATQPAASGDPSLSSGWDWRWWTATALLVLAALGAAAITLARTRRPPAVPVTGSAWWTPQPPPPPPPTTTATTGTTPRRSPPGKRPSAAPSSMPSSPAPPAARPVTPTPTSPPPPSTPTVPAASHANHDVPSLAMTGPQPPPPPAVSHPRVLVPGRSVSEGGWRRPPGRSSSTSSPTSPAIPTGLSPLTASVPRCPARPAICATTPSAPTPPTPDAPSDPPTCPPPLAATSLSTSPATGSTSNT
jgi:hypothetical protein